MRAVTTAYEEPLVGLEEPTDITNLNQPTVELGIDHEDSRWGNQKVIDVPSGLWNSTVVESLEIGNISESAGKSLLSLNPRSPRARRLGLITDGKGYLSQGVA
jgi:hypothetical protein